MSNTESGVYKAVKHTLPYDLKVVSENEGERYVVQDGNLFRKIPGKELYKKMNSALPLCDATDRVIIKVSPLNPNELWIGLGSKGLFYSLDGGVSVTKMPQITRVDYLELRRNKRACRGIEVRFTGHLEALGSRYFISMDGGISWMTSTRSIAIDISRKKFN